MEQRVRDSPTPYLSEPPGQYAFRHGYGFAFYVADTFASMLKYSAQGASTQLPWEFSKALMLRDASLKYPRASWFAWIDADAWVNPSFFDVPLTAYTDDVPKDRTAVLANFRGFNTGVLIVRGGLAGRKLVNEWLAVSRAGFAQCHPHDQAALSWLQLWHMNGTQHHVRAPYGFECTKKVACGAQGSHWSCIPLWHHAIQRAHDWHSPRLDAYDAIAPGWFADEAIDRGVANAQTPVFWIATENAKRPRLQCFRCVQSLDRVTVAPGKNFKRSNPDHQDGWLINHKAQSLFYAAGFRPQSDDDAAPCFVSQAVRKHFKD